MKKIIANNEGRLDVVLSKELNISRSLAAKYVENGVTVNSMPITKTSFKIQLGDEITYEPLVLEDNTLKKTDIPLNKVYEDDYILVINKQRGLVVHPSVGHREDTLVNSLLFNDIIDNELVNEDLIDKRPGIVHRIDKDTSGLLIIAKTVEAKVKINEMIANNEVNREYLCLINGHPKYKKFTVNVPLAKPDVNTHKVYVDPKNGKESITHFTTLYSKNNFSLLKCVLETGRTHQIRAQLAYYNLPIVNDPLYNSRVSNKMKNSDSFKGQVLHAYKISFKHPVTGKELTLYADVDSYFKKECCKAFKE